MLEIETVSQLLNTIAVTLFQLPLHQEVESLDVTASDSDYVRGVWGSATDRDAGSPGRPPCHLPRQHAHTARGAQNGNFTSQALLASIRIALPPAPHPPSSISRLRAPVDGTNPLLFKGIINAIVITYYGVVQL
jgi:hypothetical protein